MADASDIKFYSSSNSGRGGDISQTQITSGTSNNFFDALDRSQQVSGTDQYRCMYIKNGHATESIKNLSFWLVSDPSAGTLKWAEEPSPHAYKYQPFQSFNGTSTVIEGTDLDISGSFTVACWFRTSANFTETKVLVGKGKTGSETGADNFNYVLFMNSSEQVIGGFEEAGGTDHFVTSGSSYNDGVWHHAAVIYNQSSSLVTLMIDGASVGTHATATAPNTNAHNLAIGWGREVGIGYFDGDIDEVYVWDDNLGTTQITDLYTDGDVEQVDDIVYQNHFGDNNSSRIAQIIPNYTTAPVGVTWNLTANQPQDPNIAQLVRKGGYRPIWLWWHTDANETDAIDSRAVFGFKFDTTTTSTGTSGGGDTGGGGGNPPPPPTGVPDYKIAVTGDWGVKSATTKVVDLIVSLDVDLCIGVGDNGYSEGSPSQWFAKVKRIDDNQGSSTRLESAFGNHEYDDGPVGDYLKGLHQSKTYYSFDFQNVHVLILDTNRSDFATTQKTFATSDLTSAQNNNDIDWIFVTFHHPSIGCSSQHGVNQFNQVEEYFDLFRQKGVNLIFSGHNHNMQQTFPIKRSGSSAAKVISSQGPYTVGSPENWMINITSGTGGHDSGSSLYSISNPPSYNAYQSNSYNGIFYIEASANAQTLTCKFIDTGNTTKRTFVMNMV